VQLPVASEVLQHLPPQPDQVALLPVPPLLVLVVPLLQPLPPAEIEGLVSHTLTTSTLDITQDYISTNTSTQSSLTSADSDSEDRLPRPLLPETELLRLVRL
jgi:hypothetical protein